ncbi:phage tail tape measure protein, TP901 family, core region [Mesorhizobium albiziae]|uniref:Phage tail tape measure protein, TP901 family, core region n=1 Tax=Neomesorhizobium albiziae TaxID=335020 RepID=A0A1I3YC12_9HYPH|nr:phage tail tape measure protein [Mesorhizobium albiziae]GLS29959.1 hypothetical protein GCM10007937_16670 [Mesorhizobium albiziae]SFK29408.1 phage tail tape measure protein, TP901 family, core region [Mesorhizobium albiziae]
MSNRTIEAILRLSSKLGSMAAFSQLSGHLDKVDRKAKAFNRSQSMIAAGARDMHGMLLRYAAPAALAFGAKQAFVDFAELERRMTRIGITADASAAETKGAFDTIQRSAKQFALPIDQAVEAVDTLVSSGMSLSEAMDFMPSVLATAQAAGAATSDIANTAQKAASALKIEASEMQRAFDIMVTGGKEGQFELKDMASFIPELANSFASLGYEGEEGLKKLVAVLQTIREDTGSAGAAATQAQNIFGKMYSSDTGKKFADFGIDLRDSLAAAKKNGEDTLAAFVRLSKEAIDGDLSKLPLLFTDQEFRLGMQSLMTSADSYQRFIDAVNNSKVDGSVMRDLGRVLEDNQSKIDRMSASWDRFKTSVGGAAAAPVGGAMDYVSNSVDYGMAVNAGLEQSGVKGFAARSWWGITHGQDEKDGMAWRGGFRTDEQRRAIDEYGKLKDRPAPAETAATPVLKKDKSGLPLEGPIPETRDGPPLVARSAFDRKFDAYQAGAARSRLQERRAAPTDSDPIKLPDWDGAYPDAPAQTHPSAWPDRRQDVKAAAASLTSRPSPSQPSVPAPSFRETEEASMSALRKDHNAIANEIEMALSTGGTDAGQAITQAARAINDAGTTGGQSFGNEAGSVFARMLNGMAEQFGSRAAASFRNSVGSITVNARVAGGGGVNADVGRSGGDVAGGAQ